ncbi:MAG: hypothetical protein AAGH90_10540 [Pseudomonadota bacterium]
MSIHAYDPAMDGRSDLTREEARPKFQLSGPSWPNVYFADLRDRAATILGDYDRAWREVSPDLAQQRQRLTQDLPALVQEITDYVANPNSAQSTARWMAYAGKVQGAAQ